MEIEKRELQLKREETRRKMAKLLEAVALEKNPTHHYPRNAGETGDAQDQPVSHGDVLPLAFTLFIHFNTEFNQHSKP